jgi:hypothetical protein
MISWKGFGRKQFWFPNWGIMPEERDVKKIYKYKLISSTPVGRAEIRWMDNVMNGIQAMKIVNWKRCALDRNRFF